MRTSVVYPPCGGGSVTDGPITVNFTIDHEIEYEYANDTKITLANSYIRFSPTASGSYKFRYQEPS